MSSVRSTCPVQGMQTFEVELNNDTMVTVVHNLGYFPSIWVVDENGCGVEVSELHADKNSFTIEMSPGIVGTLSYR